MTERLDAAESVFYKRQLEYIAPQLYNVRYADLMARQLIPTIGGVPEWANVFTFRGLEQFGAAKVVTAYSDDLPRADASGAESSQIIKTYGASFGYNRDEIRAAMAMGVPLQELKARAARRAIDQAIDTALATGDSANGLSGILGTGTDYSANLATKSGGGLTWANGSPDEIALDIFELCSRIIAKVKGAFTRFRIVVPIEQDNLITQRRMGDGSNLTIKQFVLQNSPYVESITGWYKCDLAGASGTKDMMQAFPGDPQVVGALVPQEFKVEMPQDRNLETVVNCTARCGGVVTFFPPALGFMNGI